MGFGFPSEKTLSLAEFYNIPLFTNLFKQYSKHKIAQ